MSAKQQLGRYEIKGTLGKGAMALVLRGYDPRFGRDVAIKVLHRKFSSVPSVRQRFVREARTVASIDHPAIVPVFDAGQEGDLTYLVMRLMEGGSLHERIRAGAMLPDEIRPILDRVGAALDAAHQHGLVHRDLKPENILFDQYGEAYLGDFGIVKVHDEAVNLTQNMLVGTPAYMSPEQVRGEANIDGRSDIYSLGAVLFEMLTGQLPFVGETSMAMAMQHVTEPVPRLKDHNPSFPRQWQKLVNKAMAKEPKDRYQSGAELAAAFNETASGAATPALTTGRGRGLLFALVGILAVGFLGWGVWGMINNGNGDPTPEANSVALLDEATETVAFEQTREAEKSADLATQSVLYEELTVTALFNEISAANALQADEVSTHVAQTLTAVAPPPTDTPLPPTDTPIPTDTPPPPTDTPASTEDESDTPRAVVQASSASVREGPGTRYETLAFVVDGDEMAVIGRNQASSWYQVALNDGMVGWISTTAVETSAVTNADLPIGDFPPPPTATQRAAVPTNTPRNTPNWAATSAAATRNAPTTVPTNTPNWAATNAAATRNAPTAIPTNTPRPTNTPNWAATNEILTRNAPTAVPTNTPTRVATVPPTRTPTRPPTATPTMSIPTRTPTPASTGPLEFFFHFQNCRYQGDDWLCDIPISPKGGSGGPYTIEIMDAAPPTTYSGVRGTQLHTARGRRCGAWVHEIRVTDEVTNEVISQNVFFDPSSNALFPDGTCTLPE